MQTFDVEKLPTGVGAGFEELRAIEDSFPAELPGASDPLFSAAEVLTGNEVLLASGATVRLIGVECPLAGNAAQHRMLSTEHRVELQTVQRYAALSKEYLTRLLEDVSVAVQVVRTEDNGDTLAGYLWSVDDSLMHDPELEGVLTSPMYTCVNEGVLSSGWAFADAEEDHPMAEKYGALQDLAREGRAGLWSGLR
ncbi:MAG: thermonuclease family protein [Planctomycetota bacterium]